MFFGREPTIGNSNLTQSDLDRLLDLDDTYRTDYTYVTSKSYRPDGSDDYENPRMSRLPLSYYRRKWSFEKAREAGLLYYTYFCICDIFTQTVPASVTMIFTFFFDILRFIFRVLWYIINGIFPNPENFTIAPSARLTQKKTPYDADHEKNYASSDENRRRREEREFRPSPSPGRIAWRADSPTVRVAWRAGPPSSHVAWRAESIQSTSLISRILRFALKVITLGYFPDGNIQSGMNEQRYPDHTNDANSTEGEWRGRSEFDSRRDSTHNVRRRVRTSEYEYSEDRGSEFGYQSMPTEKRQKGMMETLIYKLFFLAFIALLAPLKTFELTIEKIIWVLGIRSSTYDLRTRTVYKHFPDEALSYSDRIAKFLSKITTSLITSVVGIVVKILFLPIGIFSYYVGRMLGLGKSKQSLTKAAGKSARHDYLPGRVFRFIFDLAWAVITGFFSFFGFILSLPFCIAEIIRERIAHALAKIFGSNAALLVGYEEVRPVTKRRISTGFSPTRRKSIHATTTTTAQSKSRLLSTKRSQNCCAILWLWLFPLLVFSLLFIIFVGGIRGNNNLFVRTAKIPYKVMKNHFDVLGWRKAIINSLNYVRDSVWLILSILSRAITDSFSYLVKRFAVMIPSQESLQKVAELPKYIYMFGQTLVEKTMDSIATSNFVYEIWNVLYNFWHTVYSSGESAVINFFKGISVLGSRIYAFIRQILSIPEWIMSSSVYTEVYERGKSILSDIPTYFRLIVGRVFESISDIFMYIWRLICYVGQLILALPSYFMSGIVTLVPFERQKTEEVQRIMIDEYDSGSAGIKREEAESNLKQLKREKELLESKMAELRRERELEETRYKDIHKAIRLVGENISPPAVNERLSKPTIVNEELLQHKIEKDFQKYIANLKKTEDDELSKRLTAIEKRLTERLNVLSKNIENEVTRKITPIPQEVGVGQPALTNELSELSSAVTNLRTEFDKLRREKEAKIAEFAHAIMSRDSKQSDNLNILKDELNNKIKEDLEKGLSSSLSRFEKASHEEREAFRSEIMKMVENRVVSLFASHLAEKSDSDSKLGLGSVPELSESNFVAIKKMIIDALDTYDADKTGKVDYALESSGASVVSTRCTEPYKENSRLESVFGIPLWYSSYSPRAVIQQRPLAAGECWAFRGKGYLTIKLSHPIYVTEVSYEHLHSTLHPEGILRSAPKLFQIYSYNAVDDLKSKFLIGEYEYDIKGRALQTFHVQNESNMPVSIVELVVQSNWNSEYTCLYRFRVHGRKA